MKKRELLSTKMTDEQKTKVHEIFPEFFDEKNKAVEKFKISVESLDEPEILYHYTSINTLEKILTESIEKKYFTLRGTHIEYLNDHQELKLAIKNIQDITKRFEKEGNDIQKKILSEKIGYNDWKLILNWGGLLTDIYITSFSENSDSLPMWNMYGSNGSGIAIGCKKTRQETDNERTRWGKCYYETEIFRNSFDKSFPVIYDSIDLKSDRLEVSGGMAFNSLSFFFCILKHKSFEFEKEWRLMKQLNIGRNTIKFHPSNGVLKPFIENIFPKSDLKKIVLGPCADQELSEQSIKMLLTKSGFSTNPQNKNYVIIKKSEAPYRII